MVDPDLVLIENLIEVFLQVVVAESVALFVLGIPITFDLVAMVRQMHEVVLVRETELAA